MVRISFAESGSGPNQPPHLTGRAQSFLGLHSSPRPPREVSLVFGG
jgi:hypothetical protein